MLIIQALKSFEIWSKEEIQIDQLFEIIRGEIVNELNW
jgi:shikimate 5-dehydrogenase